MRAVSLALTLTVASLAATPQAQSPVDRAEHTRLHAAVVPDAAEPWQTIPWRTDLRAARTEAAARGKPLFLWSMNGHPLGCT